MHMGRVWIWFVVIAFWAGAGRADIAFDTGIVSGSVKTTAEEIAPGTIVFARAGTELDGRTYTIRYSAADAAGNRTTATATVRVPHDQR
jgi:hypothetical protein